MLARFGFQRRIETLKSTAASYARRIPPNREREIFAQALRAGISPGTGGTVKLDAPAPILLMVSLKELMAEPAVKHPEPILGLALLKKLMPELTPQAPASIFLMVPLKKLMAEPTVKPPEPIWGLALLKS